MPWGMTRRAMRRALRIHHGRSLHRVPRASAPHRSRTGPAAAANSGVELLLSFVGNPQRRDRSDDHAIADGLELSGGEEGRPPEVCHIGQQRRLFGFLELSDQPFQGRHPHTNLGVLRLDAVDIRMQRLNLAWSDL